MKKIIFLALFITASFLIAKAQYTKLFDFDTIPKGSFPRGSLIYDGTFLYGMTKDGGTNGGYGVIFKIKPDGTEYSKLLDFDGFANGGSPRGSLISDGIFLYGMTARGGTNNRGVIFKVKPDGTGYSKLLDFDSTNGSWPYLGSLITDGTFLYGMTSGGGTNDWGVIFKIKPDGTGYTKLLNFSYAATGAYPGGSLLFDGTFLYGTTEYGGTNSNGVLFKIKPDGTGYSKLFDFDGTNGVYLNGSLISYGTFMYGMTTQGGTGTGAGFCPWGCEVIFKIKPDGTGFTKLLDFTGAANGRYPYGSLIFDGTFLYGMTLYGGAHDSGVMFKIKPDGTGFTKLVDFTLYNGVYPYGSLFSYGTALYGMTEFGGSSSAGVIFKYCNTVTFTQAPMVCSGQSVTVGSHTYTTTGTFIDTLTSQQGCDSTIITYLTVSDITFTHSPNRPRFVPDKA